MWMNKLVQCMLNANSVRGQAKSEPTFEYLISNRLTSLSRQFRTHSRANDRRRLLFFYPLLAHGTNFWKWHNSPPIGRSIPIKYSTNSSIDSLTNRRTSGFNWTRNSDSLCCSNGEKWAASIPFVRNGMTFRFKNSEFARTQLNLLDRTTGECKKIIMKTFEPRSDAMQCMNEEWSRPTTTYSIINLFSIIFGLSFCCPSIWFAAYSCLFYFLHLQRKELLCLAFGVPCLVCRSCRRTADHNN